MGPALPAIAAVAGAAATVYGTVQSTKAQKRAAAAQRQQQELQERRSRRQAIREMQIRRAQSMATAQGAGVLQGSGVSGGVGSLSSQFGAETGFQTQYGGLSDIVSTQMSRANRFNAIASLGGQAMGLGIQLGAADSFLTKKGPEPNRPPSAAAVPSGNTVSGSYNYRGLFANSRPPGVY